MASAKVAQIAIRRGVSAEHAGQGIAADLIADADRTVAHDFHATLAFTWPRSARQSLFGSDDGAPQFAPGCGLNYATTARG
ncbi:MAG: hypothetical protein ABI846_02840 [Rudaea sp.]